MSPTLLAAASDAKEASPIALVLILSLLIALVFLIRSMNKHLARMRTTFADEDEQAPVPDKPQSQPRPQS
jgi:hypothetical protein